MWIGDILKDPWDEPLNANWFSISTFTLCNCFSLFRAVFKGSLSPFPVAGELLPGSLSSLSERTFAGVLSALKSQRESIHPLGFPGPEQGWESAANRAAISV